MHLDPTAFNLHLNHMGQLFSWKAAFVCPCTMEHSGAADTNCPQCLGKGRIWTNAVEGKSGISGQKVQRGWAEFGTYETGDVVLSIPSDSPLYDMGEYDRVTMLQSTEPFSVSMKRGLTDDRLWFTIQSVQRVFWLDANKQIVEGGLPVVVNGQLTWPDGGEPPAFQQYSMTGRKMVEYFCFRDYPQDRAHHGGLDLPRRVVLRKFDLFDRYTTGV